MPELKTFRGTSVTDALTKVKKDLGPHAVIVNTRSFRSGALLGLGGTSVVEIVASAAGQAPQPRIPARENLTRAYQDIPQRREPVSISPDSVFLATSPRPAPRPASRGQDSTSVPSAAPVAPPPAPSIDDAGTERTTGTARRHTSSASPARLPTTPVEPAPVDRESVDILRDELGSIRTMVAQLLRCSSQTSARVGRDRYGIAETPVFESGSLPEPLFAHYTRLLDSGLDVELAQTVIASVRSTCTDAEQRDPKAVRSAVLDHLAAAIPCLPLPEIPVRTRGTANDRGPVVIAFIGPTGVGKTTTIAKLAADQALRLQRRVALITADTYRIGAVDQLKAYAEIIGIPLGVAANATEITAAIDRASDADLILIDTAGRSPGDAQRLEELTHILDAARPDHRLLVLSASASEASIQRAHRKFADLRPDRLVLSKLDETAGLGVVINAPRRAGIPLSHVTTGQDVPDFICSAQPHALAQSVLDAEIPR